MKETSYLTDAYSMTGSGRIATTIGNYLFDPMSHQRVPVKREKE
jgi:hypothetical protein